MNILEELNLQHSINLKSDNKMLLESEAHILNEVSEFGIDNVYINIDDENKNAFPAIFIKKVSSFDSETLQTISNIHRKAWNYNKVLFLYVYSDTEIRIYNCTKTPVIQKKEGLDYDKELKTLEISSYSYNDKDQIQELNTLFSKVAIDTGVIWTLDQAKFIRDKINLQHRVDKYLVESLINTTEQLKKDNLEINFIHKIILRSLFLLYLEDRKATDSYLYSEIKEGASSYFDILDDVESTYKLFKKLENHFNGNVFSVSNDENISKNQLKIVKQCFISGNRNTSQMNLLEDWRVFDFSIIQIELLSEIYESFLFKTDPSLKKITGTYYTPPSLVEFILNEKIPVNNGETDYNLKVLDPTCGSGIFLVESFKRLVKRYENKHNEKLTDFNKLKKLLTDNIFGIEIHPQAIKVAAFSLYLALLDKLDPKNIWQNKDHRLPNLINNPNDLTIKKQGNNLFCRDTIADNIEIQKLSFDLIVGNPPFGTSELSNTMNNYCNQFNFAKEMVLPFLHKAISLSPNGEIALIFNTKILTNTNIGYLNFRNWLFNECYVEKIFNFSILRNAKKNFGGQLFGNATGPISIIFYQKDHKEPSDKIIYYAPKTYIKSNIIEGLSIDSSDLKYLPREECKNPNSRIWKIAMWGKINDWELIERLNKYRFNNIESFAKKHQIKNGVGFQLLTNKNDLAKDSEVLSNLKYLDADHIAQYYTPATSLGEIKDSVKTEKAVNYYIEHYNLNSINDLKKIMHFRRLGDINAYINPHIVVKKGLEKNRVCASFIDENCAFRDGVYGFYTKNSNIDALYVLLAYFNSKFSTYYLFMTNSSYGIEREQIMMNEYLTIPINLNSIHYEKLINAGKEIIRRVKEQDFLINPYKEYDLKLFIEENIDKTIYESLDLIESEIASINHIVDYDIDLFHKKEKSIALELTTFDQIKEYANIISSELNDFIEGQDIFVNITIYDINKFSPLIMIKISHEQTIKDISISPEKLDDELSRLDKYLWEKSSTNIYFKKNLNFKNNDDIYIIRPNQKKFWTNSMAFNDAHDLIFEILNGD